MFVDDIETLCDVLLGGVKDIWLRVSRGEFDTSLVERPVLSSGQGEAYVFDKAFDAILLECVEHSGVSAIFDSEERERMITIGDAPRYHILVDPVDGSELLARGMRLSSTALSVFSIPSGDLLLSIVLDHSDGTLAIAKGNDEIEWVTGHSALPRDVLPSESLCVSYFAKSERFSMVCHRAPFYGQFRTLLNYGGTGDLLRIAAGKCDYFIEMEKGFKARDFLPGAHILRNAGGFIADHKGEEVLDLSLTQERIRFIACPSKASFEKIRLR